MDELTSAIARFDWPACERELGRLRQTIEERCELLEERIRHSGRLLLKRPDERLRLRRDSFVAAAQGYFDHGEGDSQAAFSAHVEGVRSVETGFHAVLEAVLAGPQAHLSPADHVWALIERLAREDALMQSEIKTSLHSKPFLFDPYSFHVMSDTGQAYRPDSVNAAIIDIFSSSLLMLGHQNGWFRENGSLELPSQPTLPADATFRAGLTVVLGQGWRLLDYASERWRFFGGHVERKAFPYATETGEQHEIPAIVFSNDKSDGALAFELLDTVAHERLNRLFMQVHMDLQSATSTRIDEHATHMAPTQYLSMMEAYAVIALCHALHFDVARDDTAYAGLKLREWVRGYTVLVREAEAVRSSELATLSWRQEELLAKLQLAGLPDSAARRFIEQVTFGQQHGDLFDAPLLRTADDRVHCLPHVLRITNVPRVILSHLSELSVQITRRGQALEDSLKDFLRKQGFKCERLHFWHSDEEYECDAAIVWDRTLFLFECKNRSLSAERPARRHRFIHDIIEATEQLHRVSSALPMRLDVVHQALGEQATWDRVVCCVVNGLPFGIPGGASDAYVSDMSALTRFFQDGAINVVSPRVSATGKATLMARPIRRLWTGNRPTADDFVRYLDEALQAASAIEQYQATANEWPLGRHLAVALTLIRMVPRSFEASLKSIGAVDGPDAILDDISAARQILNEGSGEPELR